VPAKYAPGPYQVLDAVLDPVPYPVVVKNKNLCIECLSVSNSEEVREESVEIEDRVMVPSGAYTSYRNLIGGLVAYAEKYLFAVDHEIRRKIDGNDVVITIRIKNVADKMLSRRRR
jgi:hypothetical protein